MIQTAALIALLGSVVAVGVPTFMRTVQRSKVAEASTELERLYQATATYYSANHGTTPTVTHCIPAPAGPTPTTPSVNSVDVNFAAESETGSLSWKALGYQPDGPIRYSYAFVPEAVGCDERAYGALATLRAHGDLDGDGALSVFERRVSVNREHEVSGGDVLLMRNRIE